MDPGAFGGNGMVVLERMDDCVSDGYLIMLESRKMESAWFVRLNKLVGN
jgi:hypothetical protein